MIVNKNDNAEIRTPAARARIQIVEDELILAEEMRGALTALGYSVSDAVVSGEEAVRLAGETRPDLVLMDIKLRGKMDGVEAAKQILDRFNIPVIYLTAFSDDATLQRAKITEPYGYVIKPVETRELHVAVEMALHRRRLEDRLMKSERWLDATLRCIGDAVIATDDAGRVVFMNPAAEGLTGWKQVDAKGLDLTEVLRVVDGASGAPVEDPATRALREETPVGPPKKTVLIGRRGAETPIDVNCAPIRDDDGAISGVVLTFRDITERERAEEALRESEEKHRSLIVNIPDVTWTTDQEGVTTFLSPNIEAVYGYAPSEIYEAGERLWLGRIHPGDVENVTRAFEALFVDGKPFDIEYRIRRKDGEWIWAHDRSISTYEKNGMRYADGVFIDITERKRAEEALRESEEKFSTIFKLSPNALVLTGIEDGKLYEINKSFTRMFGYTKEEIEGRTSLDLKIWPNRDERKEVIEKLVEEGKLEDEEIRYGVKSGEILDAQVSAAIIKVNNNPVVLAEVMDVTEKKKAERALKKAKEAAEAANRAKSEFLANMSHELRTPLNAILGFSQLLAQCSNLDPDQKRSLGAIRRAGEHLLTLIDQVLDLAKIEAGRATLVETDFDLHALLDDTEDMFRPRARDKGLDLIFERAPDAPRCARTDEIKLRQTLFNLINNSLKFTKKGGVTVRVKTSPGVPAPGVPGGFWLTFEVADTGPGVAPEELNDLFKPFVQTRSGRESREGTGLGLVISRRFVQLMGGDIKVKSEGGRGTTFTFHIQAGAADAADDHGEPVRGAIALAPDQPPCRVLIADDREDNRRLLVELLNPLGFELMEAENGWEAAEVWNERRPHVICMDMRMPVMDGREAAKAIRKRESEAAPPGSAPSRVVIIAITAGAYQESRDAALAAGCDAYLSKPFHGQDLFDLMEKHSCVRFVYEESAAPESARSAKVDKSVLTPERVSVLPGKWRARMKREADKTDPIGSNAVIARIRERDEPLAAALSVLVRRYRFDIIQELFD